MDVSEAPVMQGTINPGQGFVPFPVLNGFLFRGNDIRKKKGVLTGDEML